MEMAVLCSKKRTPSPHSAARAPILSCSRALATDAPCSRRPAICMVIEVETLCNSATKDQIHTQRQALHANSPTKTHSTWLVVGGALAADLATRFRNDLASMHLEWL